MRMLVVRVLGRHNPSAVFPVHGVSGKAGTANGAEQRRFARHVLVEADIDEAVNQIELEGLNALRRRQCTTDQRRFVRAVHLVHMNTEVRHQDGSAATAS
jgi:hypothetical protein